MEKSWIKIQENISLYISSSWSMKKNQASLVTRCKQNFSLDRKGIIAWRYPCHAETVARGPNYCVCDSQGTFSVWAPFSPQTKIIPVGKGSPAYGMFDRDKWGITSQNHHKDRHDNTTKPYFTCSTCSSNRNNASNEANIYVEQILIFYWQ